MQRYFHICRWLALVCASIVVLLAGAACDSSLGTPFSVFTQQPQLGSGAALSSQTAKHIHPLWKYQPQETLFGSITSAKGIAYVSYESPPGIVGQGESIEHFDQLEKGADVSVVDALDARSGSRLWRFQAPESLDYATKPLVAEDTIYLALTYHVCALNGQTGKLRWCSTVVDRQNSAEYILDGDMAYEDGLLFLGAYHTLIAVDAATGKRVWSVSAVMQNSHLVTGNHLVYISSLGHQLTAFEASSGKSVWHTILTSDAPDPDDPSGNFAPVPLFADGVLSLLTGPNLFVFQSSSGDLLWQAQVTPSGDYQVEEPPYPVVESVGRTAYVVAFVTITTGSQAAAELIAYDLHTHKQAWTEQVDGLAQTLGVSAGVVYAASVQSDQPSLFSSDQRRWHFWLSLLDIRSGQVLRQLQNDDSSFRVDQLVGDDSCLYVAGNRVLGSAPGVISQAPIVYALGS